MLTSRLNQVDGVFLYDTHTRSPIYTPFTGLIPGLGQNIGLSYPGRTACWCLVEIVTAEVQLY